MNAQVLVKHVVNILLEMVVNTPCVMPKKNANHSYSVSYISLNDDTLISYSVCFAVVIHDKMRIIDIVDIFILFLINSIFDFFNL